MQIVAAATRSEAFDRSVTHIALDAKSPLDDIVGSEFSRAIVCLMLRVIDVHVFSF